MSFFKNLTKGVRFFVLSVLTIILAKNTIAQDRPYSSGYGLDLFIEANIPNNSSFKDTYTFGGAGGIGISTILSNRFDLTGSIGFTKFLDQSFEDELVNYRVPGIAAIPVKIGIKYFPASFLYLKGEAGMSFFVESGSGKALILSPSFGTMYRQWDFSFKLENWSKEGSMRYIGVRLGYFFN